MIDEKKYLTDEELFTLISETEKGVEIKAPPYLKQEVISRVRNEVLIKKRQLWLYALKVAGVAAAALIFLFVMPAETVCAMDGRSVNKIEERFMERLNETADQLNIVLKKAASWNE